MDVIEGPWRVNEMTTKSGHVKLLIGQDRDDEMALAVCEMVGGSVAMRPTADYIVGLVAENERLEASIEDEMEWSKQKRLENERLRTALEQIAASTLLYRDKLPRGYRDKLEAVLALAGEGKPNAD
jgi:hypothetical protein